MDELDHQLISHLRGNARLTVAALAKRLQVARGTIQNRLARHLQPLGQGCDRQSRIAAQVGDQLVVEFIHGDN